LDGFLLITGADGRENDSYVQLFNWLFLGMFGVEILENAFLNSEYNDIIVLIKKNLVHIYIGEK
jgi:hypothetical protein